MRPTAQFGTDVGPACPRCRGTIWGYSFEGYGIAVCAGCGLVEGPLRVRRPGGGVDATPETAEGARKMHEKFREE